MSRPGGRWLIRRAPRPDAPSDLYCFPHAGGSPGEYVRWADDLLDIRIWGVQAPGRGARGGEEPLADMRSLVDAFLDAVDLPPPFALFGHSLGGLVAFEVARGLRARGRPAPDRLIVSATPPPPWAPRDAPLHELPDDALLDEVGRRFGGIPPEMLQDPSMRARIAALHRADLAVFETYAFEAGAPLDCPITTVVGDEERDRLAMTGWARHTRAGATEHVLPGGHFYLRDQRRALLRLVHSTLTHHDEEAA